MVDNLWEFLKTRWWGQLICARFTFVGLWNLVVRIRHDTTDDE